MGLCGIGELSMMRTDEYTDIDRTYMNGEIIGTAKIFRSFHLMIASYQVALLLA